MAVNSPRPPRRKKTVEQRQSKIAIERELKATLQGKIYSGAQVQKPGFKGSRGAGKLSLYARSAKDTTGKPAAGSSSAEVRKVQGLLGSLSGKRYTKPAAKLVQSEMTRAATAGVEDWDRIAAIGSSLQAGRITAPISTKRG